MSVMPAAPTEHRAASAALDDAFEHERIVFAARRFAQFDDIGHTLCLARYVAYGFENVRAGNDRGGFAHAFKLVLHLISLGIAFDDMLNIAAEKVVDLRRLTAHFCLDVGVGRRDIAAFAGVEFAKRHACGTVAVSRNAGHLQTGAASGQKRAFACMRLVAGMRRHTRKADIKLGAGQKTVVHESDLL